MSDLISRADAIDAILHNQEVYSNNFGDDPIDKYTTAIISNDVQTIAQLPSAPQWIPCSVRLPKYGIQVLTTDKDGDFELNHIIDEDDGEWFWNGAIAWMPLPEPYRKDEEKGEAE